jgi:hypothetical protein
MSSDERNILHIGRPARSGKPEITPAMVEGARQRIGDAGGTLTVWAVLLEDVYETRLGFGFNLHVQGVALNGDDARKLAALAGDSEWMKWYVKSYALALKDNMPAFVAALDEWDEFGIGDFVALLAEIPPGGTVSRLDTGKGPRGEGPFITLP